MGLVSWLALGVTQNRAVCGGLLQPPGSAWGSAPARGTRGRAGCPHVPRQPRAAEPRVASAHPVALPALQAPASPLSLPVGGAAVPPGHRARWPRDAGQGGSCLPALCSCFINHAAPRRPGTGASAGCCHPIRVTRGHHPTPASRRRTPMSPRPPSLSPPAPNSGDGRWPRRGARGDPTCRPRASWQRRRRWRRAACRVAMAMRWR